MRVGFLLDTFFIDAWCYEAIEKLLTLEGVTPCLIILNNKIKQDLEANKPKHQSKIIKLLTGQYSFNEINGYVYNRFSRWNKTRLFNEDQSAFRKKDIRILLPEIEQLFVAPIEKDFSERFTKEDIDAIKEFKPDMLFRVGFRILKGEILTLPPQGIWSYHHGDPEKYRGNPPCFWEYYHGESKVGAVLQSLTEKVDAGLMLARIIVPMSTLGESFNALAWSSAPLLYLCVKKLLESGNPILNEREKINSNGPLYRTPGLLTMALFFLKLIYLKIKNGPQFIHQHWTIYLAAHSSEAKLGMLRMKDFTKLAQPKGTFWADPFLFNHNNKDYLFFEEFNYATLLGSIKVGEISATGFKQEPVTILSDKFHFSNPFVFSDNGVIYLLPEQGESREIAIYQCVEFPNQWKKVHTLLQGGYYADPMLLKKDGKWWLFFVEKISPHGLPTVYGKLWYADSLFGPWQEHPMSPISTDCRFCRSGGTIIQDGDQAIRVVQDSSKGYGYKIHFLKITQLSESVYEDELVSSIDPEPLGFDGIHTINFSKNFTVIDTRKKTLRRLI